MIVCAVEICYTFKMVHDKRQHFGFRTTPLIINKIITYIDIQTSTYVYTVTEYIYVYIYMKKDNNGRHVESEPRNLLLWTIYL